MHLGFAWITHRNNISTASFTATIQSQCGSSGLSLWSACNITLNDFVFQFSTSKTALRTKCSVPFEPASPGTWCAETLPFLSLLWGISVHTPGAVEENVTGSGLQGMCMFTRCSSTLGHNSHSGTFLNARGNPFNQTNAYNRFDLSC